MATNAIRIDISKDSLDAALAESIGKTLERIGAVAKARAQQIIGEETKSGGTRTGKLIASITFTVRTEQGKTVLFLESTAGKYALYQHEGTGRFGTGKGAKRKRIKPKNAPFLAWQDPDTDEWIYARSVEGVRPKKFLTRGAEFAIERVLRR